MQYRTSKRANYFSQKNFEENRQRKEELLVLFFFIQNVFFLEWEKKKEHIIHSFIHHEGTTKKNNTEEEGGEKESFRVMMAEAVVDVERLKLGPMELWTGLVLHHKDVFVSHVLSKLNTTDRWFFKKVNRESRGVLEYAGVDVSKLRLIVVECSSISTLEWVWNNMPWAEKRQSGRVMDQALFCWLVAGTNKLEFLKWAREVKQCEWDEKTITVAAFRGNLEMLKYCFSNGCPYNEKEACKQAAIDGHLDYLRFLFDKVKPSRDTEKEAALQAAAYGHLDILKYFVEERKIPEEVKGLCVYNAAGYGHLDCLKYLVEEAKVPLNYWEDIAYARYFKHPDCENYLLEKGSPEPTDEEYAFFVEEQEQMHSEEDDSVE